MADNPFQAELQRREENPFEAELQKREPSLSLGQATVQAARNLPSSAAQFASDIAQPFLHPVETAKSVGQLGMGLAQKAIPGEQAQEPMVDAVGQFFAERYGGWENLKRTLAEDPVGMAADLSTLLTGGGALAARAPGMVGRVGQATRAAGRAVDPTRAAARGVGAVARPVAQGASEIVGTLGTHTGGESIRTAARAGFEGGESGRAFREAMRGITPPRTAVDEARDAVSRMRLDRGRTYTQEMAELGRRPETVDFNKITSARNRVVADFTKAGRTPKKVERVRQQVDELIDDYARDPSTHTPIGLDTLKQDLWDIQSKYATKRDSRYNYVNKVRRAVKSAIDQEAPEYSRIMKGYSEASEQIRELEATLSLTPNAPIDRALRKLMSTIRNNANTNYGRRVTLLDMLTEAGAERLSDRIAGMAMQPLAPQGMGRLVGGASVAAGVPTGLFTNPAYLALLGLQSPRAVGETVHAAGRAAGAVAPVARQIPQGAGLATYQAGRLAEQLGR